MTEIHQQRFLPVGPPRFQLLPLLVRVVVLILNCLLTTLGLKLVDVDLAERSRPLRRRPGSHHEGFLGVAPSHRCQPLGLDREARRCFSQALADQVHAWDHRHCPTFPKYTSPPQGCVEDLTSCVSICMIGMSVSKEAHTGTCTDPTRDYGSSRISHDTFGIRRIVCFVGLAHSDPVATSGKHVPGA